MPKVSVILPTFQRAAVVGHAVQALLNQTLSDMELIVCDDGSSDNTAAVAAEIQDPRLCYLANRHLGIPAVVNVGMAAAKGEYVMVCHDHDDYDPTLLEELAGALDRNPSATYAHCGVGMLNREGAVVARYVPDYEAITVGVKFFAEVLMPGLDSKVTGLTMMRRTALAGEFFDERFGPCADVEMWLRLSLLGDVAYVRKVLIRLRERDASSAFFASTCRVTRAALAAKKAYVLRLDSIRRSAVERGWRRGVNESVFACFQRALDGDNTTEIPFLRRFVREEGTFAGLFLFEIARILPRRVTLYVLNIARRQRHRRRWTPAPS